MRVVNFFHADELRRQLKIVGLKHWLTYFLFQRIFRINAQVPWPVHWSSIVICPEKISGTIYPHFAGSSPGQYIQAGNGIKIGNNVRMGPGVKIISANHDLLDYKKHVHNEPIEIGDNCWLGANSIILPGVKLGRHVVVAAGAVVTKSFDGNCLVGGVPAHIIKTLADYEGDTSW